jgi:putative endonuclease
MYVVYVLYSEKFNKIYIGFTHDLENRVKSHNELGKKGWTKSFRPWTVLYKEAYDQKSAAMTREKQLKSAKGREFVWELVKARYK